MEGVAGKETRTSLRLPEELKGKLKQEADETHRSMHNLILSIIWDHYDNKSPIPPQ